MTENQMEAMLDTALLQIHEEWLRSQITECRTLVTKEMRCWEWAKPETTYYIWIVAHAPESGVAIAYAEGGYGLLGKPWGLVSPGENGQATGPDDNWYSSFEECIKGSGYFDQQ
jgi:hypothetical protein